MNDNPVIEQPVDGAGLLPEEHVREVARKLNLSHDQMVTVLAELRNALVPALHYAKLGRVKAAKGIERVLSLCTALEARDSNRE